LPNISPQLASFWEDQYGSRHIYCKDNTLRCDDLRELPPRDLSSRPTQWGTFYPYRSSPEPCPVFLLDTCSVQQRNNTTGSRTVTKCPKVHSVVHTILPTDGIFPFRLKTTEDR